jgi:hypothetical protein
MLHRRPPRRTPAPLEPMTASSLAARRSLLGALLPCVGPVFSLIAALPPARAAVDFPTQIRPLLEKHCVECHGTKKQKANLRLDAKPFAFKGGDEGPVIHPGDATQSSLYQRITSSDDDKRMPPKGEPLSPEAIARLKDWIDSGAHWPETEQDRAATQDKREAHWSVQPVRTDFPPGSNVDSFLHAKLAPAGLSMAPEADRRTLIRRLSFDLLGLPPTPERVQRFLQDPDPDAYGKLVDEFLASPHYGERWARHWLDIAHYADTHGFERDQLRPNAWRYRDYVIESLNADKPYDRFLREQIAGDVLFPNDPKAIEALGFLGAGPWDFVGHVETKNEALRRAARAGDLDDLVTQVITASIGLTINCARCHDHKLDPISQSDYYRLWSVFSGVKRGDRETDPSEAQRLKTRREQLQSELNQLRAELVRTRGEGLDLADLVVQGNGLGTGRHNEGLDLQNGNLTDLKQGFHRDIPSNRLQKVNAPTQPKETPRFLKWVFVPNGKGEVLVDHGRPVSGVPPTSGDFWDALRAAPLNAQRSTRLLGTDFTDPGRSLLGMHTNSGATFDLELLRKTYRLTNLRFQAVLGFGAEASAAATRADFSVFVDTELRFQRLKMRKDETALIDLPIPASAKTLTLIATDGGDGIFSDLLFLGDPKLVSDSADLPAPSTSSDPAPPRALRQRIAKIEKDLEAIPEAPKVYAVLSEPQPAAVRIQRRGNPEDPAAEVTPGTIRWVRHASPDLGDQTTPEGERRRALAEWITHPANPLTRRVIVNRLWHHHFGSGLVSTPSDFGLGGDAPSHPELLDWLAEELLRNQWRLKPVHRLLVMSQAYRQASMKTDPKAASTDAQNRLLWRQNSRRLDAESLRDAVLSVSGNLNLQKGGPGFKDFRYTEAYAPVYEYVTPDGPELWRRSIYRFVVRTTPHRFMTTLDCPDPANLTPARVQTTTALQALALMNNPFLLQQSQALAQRLNAGHKEPEDQIQGAFQRILQRAPTAQETTSARRLMDAKGLASLCRMLLNTNEFLYLD